MQKQNFFYFTLVLLLVFSTSLLLAQTDAELQKKYGPILGDYEFDLSDMGMGVIGINIYVEGGGIHAFPETSSQPAEMIPVEGKIFTFSIDDPDDGHFDIFFLKDDQGKYTKCRIINEDMGMDVTGEKIK